VITAKKSWDSAEHFSSAGHQVQLSNMSIRKLPLWYWRGIKLEAVYPLNKMGRTEYA
jgi:hypothetical protein